MTIDAIVFISIVVLVVAGTVAARRVANRRQRAAWAAADSQPDAAMVRRDRWRVALTLLVCWPLSAFLQIAAKHVDGSLQVVLNASAAGVFLSSFVWIFGAPWHRPSTIRR